MLAEAETENPPEQRSSVPSTILQELRSRILRGEYHPGERLPPERELAKQFGTNRTSLREALKALQAQGLVMARHGDGVRVLDFVETGEMGLLPHFFDVANTMQKLEIASQLMRLRTAIIPQVTRSAADKATEAHHQELRQLVDKLAEAHQGSDTPALIEIELQLYRTVIDAAGSLAFRWVYNSLEKIVLGFLRSQPQMWIAVPGFVDHWRGIASALYARNGEEASARFTALLHESDAKGLELLEMFRAVADPTEQS